MSTGRWRASRSSVRTVSGERVQSVVRTWWTRQPVAVRARGWVVRRSRRVSAVTRSGVSTRTATRWPGSPGSFRARSQRKTDSPTAVSTSTPRASKASGSWTTTEARAGVDETLDLTTYGAGAELAASGSAAADRVGYAGDRWSWLAASV